MKRAYVAGPYRADTEHGVVENIRRAGDVSLELWKLGFAALCPHMNTALFGGAANDDVWLAGDLEWLQFAELVVLVPGWRGSAGTLLEKRTAEHLGIPVYEWETDLIAICRLATE